MRLIVGSQVMDGHAISPGSTTSTRPATSMVIASLRPTHNAASKQSLVTTQIKKSCFRARLQSTCSEGQLSICTPRSRQLHGSSGSHTCIPTKMSASVMHAASQRAYTTVVRAAVTSARNLLRVRWQACHVRPSAIVIHDLRRRATKHSVPHAVGPAYQYPEWQ
jgi:hypothetical protein